MKISGIIRSHANGILPRIFLPLLFIIFYTSNTYAGGPPEDSGNESAVNFSILGSSVQGEFLIITYKIPYPGMMKVKMFDSNQEMLWRNQYVDDIKSEHKMILRKDLLDPGSYQFEFSYKNFEKTYSVSL